MTSLYIHIPFCARKCRYCDFYSVNYDSAVADTFIDSLVAEWELLRKEYPVETYCFDTVYFGGGTPSVLNSRQWERLCAWVKNSFRLKSKAEWSVECNPESFTQDKSSLWLNSGVNRLTVGVQSLDDRLLKLLGRPHSAIQAQTVLEDPSLCLYNSVGADLMLALPWQSGLSLESSLDKVLSSGPVSHVSVYELSIHENTPFGKHQNLLTLKNEEETADMLDIAAEKIAKHGFEQYEISNFALPGHRSRHNQAYWNHEPYVGLGPSAHSLILTTGITEAPADEFIRCANVSDVAQYCDKLKSNIRPLAFTEKCTSETFISEMLFLRFRTSDGLDETVFEQKCGEKFCFGLRMETLKKFTAGGYLEYDKPWWRPTTKGLRVADAIARELM
jgi:oxygen-independent coproporphyrinogen-3 oxidase